MIDLPDILFNRRVCDSCSIDECQSCEHSAGRRLTDNCSSHEDMVKARGENELFREKMKVGIAVCAFFLLAFMGWIASSNYLSAQDMKGRQDKFEEATKTVQKEHKEDVSLALKEMRMQMNAVVSAAQRIESNVEVLVRTSKAEVERANEERKENHRRIEKLERSLPYSNNE